MQNYITKNQLFDVIYTVNSKEIPFINQEEYLVNGAFKTWNGPFNEIHAAICKPTSNEKLERILIGKINFFMLIVKVPEIKSLNILKHKYDCNCQGECLYNFDIKLFEIDEVSMLDIFMFYDILKVCKKFNARLILLGDVDQLPSIGPGKVLFQLIILLTLHLIIK
jgi:hypothetical protein